MASQENGLGEYPQNNHNLSLVRVKKEEPMDDYGEAMDKDSRISHLMERLVESEKRARKAEEELEVARANDMDMMEKTLDKFKIVRKNLNRKLEESEKAREKVEESLKREKTEREREVEEAKKRQAELKKENEDLHDRPKKLTEQLESNDVYLAEMRSKLCESESRSAQLDRNLVDQRKKFDEEETRLKDVITKVEKRWKDTQIEAAEVKGKLEKLIKDLDEMREMNGFLATTGAGKIYDELSIARKRIEYLEKKAEVVTPKSSYARANKRKRTEEHSLHIEDSNEFAEFHHVASSLDNLSTIPNFTHNSFPMKTKEENVEPKEEPVETIGDNVQISTLDTLGDQMDFMGDDTLNDNVIIDTGSDNAMEDDQIEREGEASIDHTTEAPKDSMEDDLTEKERKKDSCETVEIEKRRRSSRLAIKPLKPTETHGDSDSEPAMKKLRSDSKKENDKMGSSCNRDDPTASDSKNQGVKKQNGMELECPECEFRTRNVQSWYQHLVDKHSTNPNLAGLALLCGCGHESFSYQHSGVCTVGNFTVIRKRDGPIRRISKPTVKCVLCEFYPKTPTGYTTHLRIHHKSKSTLSANGIYLICACGLEIRTQSNDHAEGCDHRQFTLHKLDEK